MKDAVAFTYATSFVVVKKPITGSSEKEAEQDVDSTSGTNKNDKYNKEDSENAGYTIGITNSAKPPDWKIIAASIPQD